MFFIPIFVFYSSYIFIFEQKEENLMWSGLLSVVSVNFVIAAYVYSAWNEEDDEIDENKKNEIIKEKETKKTM